MPACSDDEFQCANGRCIDGGMVMDYVKDCEDGADEKAWRPGAITTSVNRELIYSGSEYGGLKVFL